MPIQNFYKNVYVKNYAQYIIHIGEMLPGYGNMQYDDAYHSDTHSYADTQGEHTCSILQRYMHVQNCVQYVFLLLLLLPCIYW